jgi:dephospho-CoA kinase
MLVVGLTGGVATGKSLVSRIFKEEGATLIDADQIARELVQPQTPAWKELIILFGKEILQEDESIHRKKLAARIFSDPKQQEALNRILHPRIKEEIDRSLKEIGRRDPEAIVVIDAALLIETGDYREMDQVVVVTSTEAQQIERLRARDGRSPEEARRIVASQMGAEEKMKGAHFVLKNEGSVEETERRAKGIFQKLKEFALCKKNANR